MQIIFFNQRILMTTLFYAENRETGKRWKPYNSRTQSQHLIMYDNGELAFITETEYESYVSVLDPHIWKTVYNKFE